LYKYWTLVNEENSLGLRLTSPLGAQASTAPLISLAIREFFSGAEHGAVLPLRHPSLLSNLLALAHHNRLSMLTAKGTMTCMSLKLDNLSAPMFNITR
jgi:hypothetical protein